MKKIVSFILLPVILLFLSSCHHSKYRNISIRTSENNFLLDIRFAGEVRFTSDSTNIKSISPEGYLR